MADLVLEGDIRHFSGKASWELHNEPKDCIFKESASQEDKAVPIFKLEKLSVCKKDPLRPPKIKGNSLKPSPY